MKHKPKRSFLSRLWIQIRWMYSRYGANENYWGEIAEQHYLNNQF